MDYPLPLCCPTAVGLEFPVLQWRTTWGLHFFVLRSNIQSKHHETQPTLQMWGGPVLLDLKRNKSLGLQTGSNLVCPVFVHHGLVGFFSKNLSLTHLSPTNHP